MSLSEYDPADSDESTDDEDDEEEVLSTETDEEPLPRRASKEVPVKPQMSHNTIANCEGKGMEIEDNEKQVQSDVANTEKAAANEGETSIAKTKGHVCIFCGKLQ